MGCTLLLFVGAGLLAMASQASQRLQQESVSKILVQKAEILLAYCGRFIRQMVPRFRQQQHPGLIEPGFEHFKVMLPIHGFIGLALNHQWLTRTRRRILYSRDPARQRAHPGRGQTQRLQRVGLQERQESRVVGVLAKTPGNAFDERAWGRRWARCCAAPPT